MKLRDKYTAIYVEVTQRINYRTPQRTGRYISKCFFNVYILKAVNGVNKSQWGIAEISNLKSTLMQYTYRNKNGFKCMSIKNYWNAFNQLPVYWYVRHKYSTENNFLFTHIFVICLLVHLPNALISDIFRITRQHSHYIKFL